MVIGIRADASPIIGTGHIMRCLTLAEQFSSRGNKVIFFSRYDLGIDEIKSKKYEVVKIPSSLGNSEGFFYDDSDRIREDEKSFCELLSGYSIDMLIIDTYNMDFEYFLEVKKRVKVLAYVDDMNVFAYPVDIVINGNVSAPYMHYKKYYNDTKFLLGTDYTILRPEFRDLQIKNVDNPSRKVKEIMITTGGSDNYNISEKIINAILEHSTLKHLIINVVVGKAFKNIEILLKIKSQNSNVNLYWTYNEKLPSSEMICSTMSSVMLKSDIAFSAAGSTVYELCRCGCIILTFVLADNQLPIAETMHKEGYAINLGWYDTLRKHKIQKSVSDLISNEPLRIQMKQKVQKLVDGDGVNRIVSFIEKYRNRGRWSS